MSRKKNYNDYYKNAKNELSKNNYESAIENYKKSLNLKENNIACLTELGNLYERLNNFNEAIEYYKKIILIENNVVNKCITLNQIGVCYSNMKYYKNAIEYFEKILQTRNDIPDVYNNIAFCYLQLKNYKLCETNYYNSLRIQKNDKVYSALGELYFYTKKYELAIKCYEKIEDFNSNDKTKYNCSFPYLANKKFIEGFKLYQHRLNFNNVCQQTQQIQRVEIPQIADWDGKQECNSLLVIYEQGIGDNIQFYRYIIELSELHPNMKIDYFCKDIVQGIFNEYNNIHIIQNVNIPDYDYKIFIMSLPYILNINMVYPNEKNYIKIHDNKVEYWKNELSDLKKYKVGITCNGLLSSIIDKNIPLHEFAMLFDSNIDLICIHKLNEISEEHKNIFKDKIKFVDIDKDIPFQDTIAILHSLDLLITVDTFIVHLAGILNVKTWLLLGNTSDWRWFNDDVCHWYKSVEILRMKENKELKHILPDVKEKLNKITM
jgi:tetratricopeptide (TPR) repeat protein